MPVDVMKGHLPDGRQTFIPRARQAVRLTGVTLRRGFVNAGAGSQHNGFPSLSAQRHVLTLSLTPGLISCP